jgi:hypothetical protein
MMFALTKAQCAMLGFAGGLVVAVLACGIVLLA